MYLLNIDSDKINLIIEERLNSLSHKDFDKRSFYNGFYECFSELFKTGIYDKNGTEIEIGNHVKNSNNHIFKVIFKNGCLYLNSLKFSDNLTLLKTVNKDIVVIQRIKGK